MTMSTARAVIVLALFAVLVATQGRKARGLLRRHLEKMTGLSRAQVTRLITPYRANGELQPAPYQAHLVLETVSSFRLISYWKRLILPILSNQWHTAVTCLRSD